MNASLQVGAAQHFTVRNPRTGGDDFDFTAPTSEELRMTVSALRVAQATWAARALDERIAALRAWQKQLVVHRERIVLALSEDTGRDVLSVTELASVLAMIDRWCVAAPQLALEEEGRSQSCPSVVIRSQYVPYALVGVICPWNFPLTLALIDAIPALLAGCAVFVKPSEIAPRFSAPLAKSIENVPGLSEVLRIVPAGRSTGEELISLVDAVCFTGSVASGREVAKNAARHFVPAFLELGGKDPAIVTASADLGRAARIVLRASCLATGQACQSLERVYVDRRVFDGFVSLLVDQAAQVDVGPVGKARGVIGPFIWEGQAEIVASQIADARRLGARVLCGGQIERSGGLWMRPTVLVGVDHRMRVMREETFGPIMPIMAYDSIDEAIALANEGDYGLSAAVIAGTLDEAEEIGRSLDAGAVSLNDGALTGVVFEAEKNSFKQSGMGGSRMGPAGYTRFFRRKALLRQTGEPLSLSAF